MLYAGDLDKKALFAAFLPQSYPQNATDLPGAKGAHGLRWEIVSAFDAAFLAFAALILLA
ncbi:hypothetical protein [Acetobacter sp. DsW_063]|uniref:hypothetical protein n=1 Tax=Acetobacter sp. DsW_063 TaxID=1514894 RepID=UPI000A3AD4A3|nr:hypothetical protein [Acetobacter sp. DsW_063]OUJ16333.1 hypothetical protein HK28_01625 [Acetobacter sp. DsW_063]